MVTRCSANIRMIKLVQRKYQKSMTERDRESERERQTDRQREIPFILARETCGIIESLCWVLYVQDPVVRN